MPSGVAEGKTGIFPRSQNTRSVTGTDLRPAERFEKQKGIEESKPPCNIAKSRPATAGAVCVTSETKRNSAEAMHLVGIPHQKGIRENDNPTSIEIGQSTTTGQTSTKVKALLRKGWAEPLEGPETNGMAEKQ